LVVRELSYGLAAASLPAFLVSLVALLPTRRGGQILAVVGLGVTGAALALFEAAYPTQWTSTATGQTAVVVSMYAAGLFALVVAVVLAIRTRQAARTHDDGRGGLERPTDAPDGPPQSEAADD
jgi:peptidoglycan/LPS O-acetylase OafA/YrhL